MISKLFFADRAAKARREDIEREKPGFKQFYEVWEKEKVRTNQAKLLGVLAITLAATGAIIRTKGSHRQFKHLRKPGAVTISGNLGKEMPPGTLNSVLKQARLKE